MQYLKLFSIIIIFIFSVNEGALLAQKIPAFPGAEGFGKYSVGGRGGEVIKVTSLKDDGPGSLREAIEAEGPRIVVFEVGGTIDLKTPAIIQNPYITIAGQTAPGHGINIRGNQIHIQTHDVILRFLRIRPGDVSFGPENTWSGIDAINIGKPENHNIYNIIIDHCSLSWSVDEVVGIWRSSYNITIQNSIISEGLNHSKHPKGGHSKGVLVGADSDSISILNNLILHHMERSPRVSNAGSADVRNNIIYNPGNFAAKISNSSEKVQNVNFVRNLFISGPNTDFEYEFSVWAPDRYNGKIYLNENIGFDGNEGVDNWEMIEHWQNREPLNPDLKEEIRSDSEFVSKVTTTKNFDEMKEFTYNYIGASLPVRDEVDKRLINELINRKGKIIHTQNQVGGWPVYRDGPVRVDTNGNGIPDDWMEKYDIQPGEEHEDFNGNGYTNIEEYLNGTNPRSVSTFQSSGTEGIFDFFLNQQFETNQLKIEQNFPNPFRDYTKIRFEIETEGDVVLKIFDSIGREVSRLVNTEMTPGRYEIIWAPERIASGVYFSTISLNGRIVSRPMTLIN